MVSDEEFYFLAQVWALALCVYYCGIDLSRSSSGMVVWKTDALEYGERWHGMWSAVQGGAFCVYIVGMMMYMEAKPPSCESLAVKEEK